MWLSCSGAVRNITSQTTAISYTNSSDEIQICQGIVRLGDGVNNLDGTGGDFELTLQFGDRVTQPDPQLIYFSTAVQANIFTTQFPLPINETVTLKIKSPNTADTSVWVHACVYEVSEISQYSYATGSSNTITNTYTDTGGVYPNG